MGPYGPKIEKIFRFDKLGAGGDDTWLGGGAPRRKVSPNQERIVVRIVILDCVPKIRSKQGRHRNLKNRRDLYDEQETLSLRQQSLF